MQPTAFIPCLPVGESELVTSHAIDKASVCQLGPSAISMNVCPDTTNRGFSLVPFASLLGLGDQFPHLRSISLHCIMLRADDLKGALAQAPLPRFALLESLTILPWVTWAPGESPVTTSLLILFPHMPRLQNLTVDASMAYPHYEMGSPGPHLPVPPFSLKRFSCVGVLSLSACAHIISCSIRTLEELTINVDISGVHLDEARLVAAIARAAPRLRVLDLRLRGNHDLWLISRPVFVALTRVETLRLDVSLALHDALELLGGSCASLRQLDIRCERYSHVQSSPPASPLSAQLVAFLTPLSLLRSVTLRGFAVRDEELAAVLVHCRACRIRCGITLF